jgi:hypothetical protein
MTHRAPIWDGCRSVASPGGERSGPPRPISPVQSSERKDSITVGRSPRPHRRPRRASPTLVALGEPNSITPTKLPQRGFRRSTAKLPRHKQTGRTRRCAPARGSEDSAEALRLHCPYSRLHDKVFQPHPSSASPAWAISSLHPVRPWKRRNGRCGATSWVSHLVELR